jgi:hypothetical protein
LEDGPGAPLGGEGIRGLFADEGPAWVGKRWKFWKWLDCTWTHSLCGIRRQGRTLPDLWALAALHCGEDLTVTAYLSMAALLVATPMCPWVVCLLHCRFSLTLCGSFCWTCGYTHCTVRCLIVVCWRGDGAVAVGFTVAFVTFIHAVILFPLLHLVVRCYRCYRWFCCSTVPFGPDYGSLRLLPLRLRSYRGWVRFGALFTRFVVRYVTTLRFVGLPLITFAIPLLPPGDTYVTCRTLPPLRCKPPQDG